MAVTFSLPFSIPKVSVALVAGYALWILLAGTVKMPSWFLRQLVALTITVEKVQCPERTQDSIFPELPRLAWPES